MTTLRDRIAALLHAAYAEENYCLPWEELTSRERERYLVRADAILALFRDEAPPSDEELRATFYDSARDAEALALLSPAGVAT